MNLGTNPGLSGTASSYESSFSQILNRTQQNLSRINQRYANNTGAGVPPSKAGFGVAPITLGSNQPLLANPAFPRLGTSFPNQNSNPNYFSDQQQQLAISQGNVAPPLPPTSHLGGSNTTTNAASGNGNTVNIDEQTLNSILARLSSLEQQQENTQTNQSTIKHYEKSMERFEKNLDNMLLEMKDIQRQFSQIHTRMNNNQTIIDNISMEYEKITQNSLKSLNWMKDYESWRENMQDTVNKITKDHYKQEHIYKQYEENTSNYLNKYEFQVFQDKIMLLISQNVTSTYSILQDKIQEQIKSLEKEMILLKVGQSYAVTKEMNEFQAYMNKTISSEAQEKQRNDEDEDDLKEAGVGIEPSTSMKYSPEIIGRVLGQPMPSELMIKGLISNEVFTLQNSLEEKVSVYCGVF